MIRSRSLIGLEAYDVEVTAEQADEGTLEISGLWSDAHRREARVRVMAALAHCGLSLGARVVIEGQKKGSSAHLDLAIAAAVLQANGIPGYDSSYALIGELSLDGAVRPVRGITPMLAGCFRAIVPEENGEEASRLMHEPRRADEGDIRAVETLQDVINGVSRPCPRYPDQVIRRTKLGIVLVGPPGSLKTLRARSLAAALPFEPSRELDAVYSVAGLLPGAGYVGQLPFRAPHHSVSEAGLVGGGSPPRPGEVSLAHRGVLLLDEICEFRTSVLDALFAVVRADAAGIAQLHGGGSVFPSRPALIIGTSDSSPRLATLLERYSLEAIPVDKGFTLAQALTSARES